MMVLMLWYSCPPNKSFKNRVLNLKKFLFYMISKPLPNDDAPELVSYDLFLFTAIYIKFLAIFYLSFNQTLSNRFYIFMARFYY